MRVSSALFARSVWKGDTPPEMALMTLPILTRFQAHTLSRMFRRRNFTSTLTDNARRLPIVRPKPGERTPPIKTQARSATILPNFVGLVFQIYNGKVYNSLQITEDMVGHKLGEFSA